VCKVLTPAGFKSEAAVSNTIAKVILRGFGIVGRQYDALHQIVLDRLLEMPNIGTWNLLDTESS